jgi:probable rRNA maturation factor
MSVFLANEQADYRVDEPALTRLARLVMDAEGVEESEISLLLVDRTVMTDLNERYMGEDRPTDVLAFPIDGTKPTAGPRELGDVVICPEHCSDVSEAAVHGVLHLCGYDHETDSGEMLALQAEVIEGLA